MPKLKYFELNISFAIQNVNELLETIEQAIKNAKPIFIKVICVTYQYNNFREQSSNAVFNKEELSQQGVELIL